MEFEEEFEKEKCSVCKEGFHFSFCQSIGTYNFCYSTWLENRLSEVISPLSPRSSLK